MTCISKGGGKQARKTTYKKALIMMLIMLMMMRKEQVPTFVWSDTAISHTNSDQSHPRKIIIIIITPRDMQHFLLQP